jgi:hypothetical protein
MAWNDDVNAWVGTEYANLAASVAAINSYRHRGA